MAYIETGEGWQTDEDRDDGQSATRRFYNENEDAGGGLPAMGSTHPTLTNTYVKHITKFKIQKDKRQQWAVVTYAPYDDDNPNEDDAFADLPRSMDISGEMLSIDSDNRWWDSDNVKIDPTTKIFKRVVTGTLRITERVADQAVTRSKVINAAGKVNDATFEGFGVATWLYMGADSEEVRDSSGVKRWNFTHIFAFRKVGTISSSGWYYSWRQDANKWDKSVDTPGGGSGYIYNTTTFADIFSTT
jgi:hypothetical protein